MPKRRSTQTVPDVCEIMTLPPPMLERAAYVAADINPANRPAVRVADAFEPQHLAVMTTKYWGAGGVDLTVGFLEETPADLRDLIINHMNAWSYFANVRFRWSKISPQVRISRGTSGYWSYLGTDILSVPMNQPTMSLSGFTMKTSDAEFRRVVRHETGHTLGFPHEHQRADIVALLDPLKTVAYFRRTQGWDERTTRLQVLTPIAESSLMGTPRSDPDSIMAYQFPGEVTKSGAPILGGEDIGEKDKEFAGKLYPRPSIPVRHDNTFSFRVEVDSQSRTARILPPA